MRAIAPILVSLIDLCYLSLTPAASITYVVNPEGTGDFPTIQAALDAAVEGDVIELADGIFSGEGNRDLYYLGKAVTVRSQSGNAETCVVDCQSAGRGLAFTYGEGPGSVLQAVTITNGLEYCGGSVLFSGGSSPSLIGCSLSGNNSDLLGGAVCCVEGSSPTLVDCVLNANVSVFGGGVYCSLSSPEFTGCVLIDNSADHSGGAANINESSSARFTDCTMADNYAGHSGGGVYSRGGSNPHFEDCTFGGNTATFGGGLRCVESSPTCVSCVFSDNWIGGGVDCSDHSYPSLVSCIFAGNSGDHGAGISCTDSSNPAISSCVFKGNRASSLVEGGGAVYCRRSSPTIRSCTLSGNSSIHTAGALYCVDESFPMILRTIVRGNCAELLQSEIYVSESSGVSMTCCATDSLEVAGDGMITYKGEQVFSDPIFCSPEPCENAPTEEGNYTLSSESPCLPGNNECRILIGALPVGCPVSSVPDPPEAVPLTWGRLKTSFRK